MDYHVFNRVFRGNPRYDVLAFTAAAEQNLGTTAESLRRYPAELAGQLYRAGIPTVPETRLSTFIREHGVDVCVLAYSDASNDHVMRLASQCLAAGAEFRLLPPARTMIRSRLPVIAVTAVRTGCGKSQMSLRVMLELQRRGIRAVAVREPMPYGDLVAQRCMKFQSEADLKRFKCTIEEREEYEQYVDRGLTIYSGVDYETIAEAIEQSDAQCIVFDGGNNEVPFFKPTVHVCLADALRPGHELGSHPGQVNARMADYLLICKEDSALPADVATVERNLRGLSSAPILHCVSPVSCSPEDAAKMRGKRVLVVEDGPTLTHGGMAFGKRFPVSVARDSASGPRRRRGRGSKVRRYDCAAGRCSSGKTL